MLTDEDLLTGLRAGYRDTTDDLRYRGRRRPRRTAPLMTGAAVLVVAAVVGGVAVSGAARQPLRVADGPQAGTTPSAAPTPAVPTTVVDEISLAGYDITFEREVGATAPVRAELRSGTVPDGLTSVQISGTDDTAHLGTDPVTGDDAVFVETTAGRVLVLLSATWSSSELARTLTASRAIPVPLVD